MPIIVARAHLDHRDRRRTFVRIFQLRFHASRAEIGFRAYARAAQFIRHRQRVRDTRLIHHQHDNRTIRLGRLLRLQRRRQTRDANRESRRRNPSTTEACDKIIVAPAAADRTKHAIAADELPLEHSAGVIFKSAHDGRIDLRIRIPDTERTQRRIDGAQF